MDRHITTHAVELGLLLKQIPYYSDSFSMSKFDDRIKLQKRIYLLQAFEVYLGYDFSWNLRGPYCSLLTANAFAIQDIYNTLPDKKLSFKSAKDQKNFKRYLEFINEKDKDDVTYLEIVSSIHYLSQGNLSEDEIINEVFKRKQKHLDNENDGKKYIKNILNDIKKYNLTKADKNLEEFEVKDSDKSKKRIQNVLDEVIFSIIADANMNNDGEKIRIIDSIFNNTDVRAKLNYDENKILEISYAERK